MGDGLTGALRRCAFGRALHSVQPDHAAPVHVSGPRPHRVLVIGADSAAGFEARTDELTLPGHFARHFAAIGGRGVDVDVIAQAGMDAADALGLLGGDERELSRYSCVVLSVAAAEIVSFLSERRWTERLDRLLSFLDERTNDGCRVVILLPRLTSWVPYVAGPVVDRVTGRAARWIHAAGTVAARHPKATLFLLPARTTPSGTPWRAADYDRWGRALAECIHRLVPRDTRSGLEETISEDAIQRTTGSLPVIPAAHEGRSGEEVSLILNLTKEWFEADAVALTVFDGDEVVITRAVGMAEGARTPREATPCDATVRRPAGHVVPRMDEHPDYAPLAERTGLRFYAGYRIEAANGLPVGTLCVFRTEPGGSLSEDDMAILRDFALRLSAALVG